MHPLKLVTRQYDLMSNLRLFIKSGFEIYFYIIHVLRFDAVDSSINAVIS